MPMPSRSATASLALLYCLVVCLTCCRPTEDNKLATTTLGHASSGSARRAFGPWLEADSADSIALERTGCYGWCPAYRVRLARDGSVQFVSRETTDSGRTATGRISGHDFRELAMFAGHPVHFLDLPANIRAD